jgi:transcriptional regulator with XRE-family HTH domain
MEQTFMKAKIQQSFGSKIRDHRIKLGISQEELAFRSGLHRTYIGGIERGERNPTLLTIVKIAKALRTDCHLLLKVD